MLLAASETMELADGVRHGAEFGGGRGGFFLFPLLIFLLFGFLLFRLMRRGRHAAFAMGHGGAMNTLSDRFARGEISREEFEYRRAILNKDKDIPPAPPFTSPPATGHSASATDDGHVDDPLDDGHGREGPGDSAS